MKEPVRISIKSLQRLDDSPEDSVELITAGTLAPAGSGYLLSYEESEITGMEGTVTSFCLQPDRITLTREGSVNSQMIFQAGQRHLSLYETPYGELSITVLAKQAAYTMDKIGGTIEIDYILGIDNLISGENFFSIQVKRQPSSGAC